MHPDARLTLAGGSAVALGLFLVNLELQSLIVLWTNAGLFASAFAVAMLFDRLGKPA